MWSSLFRRFPNHPDIPHYLIYACDNPELAPRSLPAARAYSGTAPSRRMPFICRRTYLRASVSGTTPSDSTWSRTRPRALEEDQLRASCDSYWATQVDIMKREIVAFSAQASHRFQEPAAILTSAAEDEDGVEKLPVTPGPIVPAREQLEQLLLEQGNSGAAIKAFEAAVVNTPGRRGTLGGLAHRPTLPISPQNLHTLQMSLAAAIALQKLRS